MTITKKQENGALCIALEGRLDTVTSPELEAELKNALDGINALTIDISKLDYISSAGLRVLLWAHKSLYGKAKMKIVHPTEIVKEVFEVTGFGNILNIED